MDRNTELGNNDNQDLKKIVETVNGIKSKTELSLQDWDMLAAFSRRGIVNEDIEKIVLNNVESIRMSCSSIENKTERKMDDWDFSISIIGYLTILENEISFTGLDRKLINNAANCCSEIIKKDVGAINKFLDDILMQKSLSKEEWDFIFVCIKNIQIDNTIRNNASLCIKEKIVKPIVTRYLFTHKILGTIYGSNYYYEDNYKEDLVQAGWLASFLAAEKYNRYEERKASFSTYAYMEVENAVQQLFLKTVSPINVHYNYDKEQGKYLPDRRVQTICLSSFVRANNQETNTEMEELIGIDAVDYILNEAKGNSKKLFIVSFVGYLKKTRNNELINIIYYIISNKSKFRMVDIEKIFSITRSRIDFLFREAIKQWKKNIVNLSKYKMVLREIEDLEEKIKKDKLREKQLKAVREDEEKEMIQKEEEVRQGTPCESSEVVECKEKEDDKEIDFKNDFDSDDEDRE